MTQEHILFTGGSGLLGSEVKQLLPAAHYPTSSQFNVTNYQQMQEFIANKTIALIIHAAAFTSPPLVDKDPAKGIAVNIIGTANLVQLCMTQNIRLLYISTDYVFKGDRGNYKEDDSVLPVNKYAWSKLGGECAVKMYDNALIVRTSFGPNVFPYPKAFVDQWTSRECVRDIAKKIVALTDTDLKGTIHIGGPRRTVYDYAKSLDPAKDIAPLSIHDIAFTVPPDTSLDCSYFQQLMTTRHPSSS